MASFVQTPDYYGSSDNKSSFSCFGLGGSNNNQQQQQVATFSASIPTSMQQHSHEETIQEMKSTEEFLASELNKLTVHERAQALDDVHCVGEELQETPEMIDHALREFDLLVNQMQNPIYQMAQQQNSLYVQDPAFRLRFLRCNMYNVQRSVHQMMDFLKHKATYFGEDKLGRDITLEDLSEEDLALLQAGLYHIQDGRDRTGRVILYVMTEMLGRCKIENLIHVAYYIWNNIMIPIPEVQTKGVVGVYYDVTKPGEKLLLPGLNFMLTLFNVLMTFPLRYSAIHVCPKSGRGNLALNNSVIRYCMNLFPQYARVRTRLHYGTDMEVQYSLRGHGFPIDSFPVDVDGNIRRDILNVWFENHKEAIARTAAATAITVGSMMAVPNAANDAQTVSAMDDEKMDDLDLMSDDLDEQFEEFDAEFPMQQDTEVVEASSSSSPGSSNATNGGAAVHNGSIVPTENDVLLGRGRGVQHHEGNVRFRKMLEPYRVDYDRTPRRNRRQYSSAVTHFLLGNGIRFLQKTDDGDWMSSSFEEADRKVGQLFRTLRKKV